jgi:hypothetical protein
MTKQSRETGSEFFARNQTAEKIRNKFIEAPLESAQQSVLTSGLEIANLLSILPDAFLASQHRELERVKKSGKGNSPRTAALQASIEQTDVLRTTVQRGQARVRRIVVALTDSDDLFHGFVSDAEFVPLKGLKVRLVDSGKTRGAKMLSATSDHDGYFRIPLDVQRDAKSRAKSDQMNLSERITNLFAGSSKVRNTAASTDSSAVSEGTGQVEILKKGKVVYRDPVLVSLGQGSVYREYVIASDKPPSASEFRKFMAASQRSSKPTDVSSSEGTTKKSPEASSSRSKPKKMSE